MLQKVSMAILVLLAGVGLVSCDTVEPRTDSEILIEVRDSVTFDTLDLTEDIVIPEITEEGVTATWTSSAPEYLDIDGTITRPAYYQTNQSVSITLKLEKGDIVITKVFEFNVLKDDVPGDLSLNTSYTDEFEMDFEYEQYSFIDDGVGEVTLVQCVDGDTARFTEGGTTFSVRFMGINTPESTAKFEPWGKDASAFTCDKLENASTIVLQADSLTERMDSYNERWLGWVWYDGRLLNLELLEQAYTKPSGGINTKYGQLLYNVSLEVKYTERRVWGEVDESFDYSREGIQLTIEELVTNPEEYVGLKVSIQGIVSRRVGAAVFIQEGDWGVYVYNRVSFTPNLTQGNEVIISGLTVTYYPDPETGSLQVSGYQEREQYSQVVSTDNTVTPQLVTVPDITDLHLGRLLMLEDMKVDSVYGSDEAFTVTLRDSGGNTITLRKAEQAPDDITKDMFTVGDTITIVAPLSRYQSNYQLMLSLVDDISD